MRSITVNELKRSVVVLLTIVFWMIDLSAQGQEAEGYKQTWAITGPRSTISGQKYILTATVGYPDAGVANGEVYSLIGAIRQGTVSVRIVTFHDIARFTEQWLGRADSLAFDLDRSGVVDSIDYACLAEKWLAPCAADWP